VSFLLYGGILIKKYAFVGAVGAHIEEAMENAILISLKTTCVGTWLRALSCSSRGCRHLTYHGSQGIRRTKVLVQAQLTWGFPIGLAEKFSDLSCGLWFFLFNSSTFSYFHGHSCIVVYSSFCLLLIFTLSPSQVLPPINLLKRHLLLGETELMYVCAACVQIFFYVTMYVSIM
jgi:hypothetical protein